MKGNQKKLLAEVLTKPMTGTELLCAMQSRRAKEAVRAKQEEKSKPNRVRKGDVRLLLRKYEKRNLVLCLTPNALTGRVYFFTEEGRQAVREALNIEVEPLPKRLNWRKYSFIQRGATRRLVLLELGNSPAMKPIPRTATQLRKRLVGNGYPIGRGAALRAIIHLKQMGLIRKVGVTKQRSCPLYLPTKSGKRIIAQLRVTKEQESKESSTEWDQNFLSSFHEEEYGEET